MPSDPLGRVCLAISAFRGSHEVFATVNGLARETLERFAEILVVDSGESSRLAALLEPFPVRYRFLGPANLGSAGNLAERLRLAAELDCEWVFALNHDGVVDVDVIESLVKVGETDPTIAAVYPRRRFPNRGGAYGRPASGRSVDLVWWGPRTGEGLQDTSWSSSNGALYRTEPLRRGLLPWADLWMGWEDLAFGWLLEDSGYRQVIADHVTLDDNYEFKLVGPRWLGLTLSDKPAWYTYYFARNLVLTTVRLHRPKWKLAERISVEFIALGFRSSRRRRFRLLVRGLIDGSLGKTGKMPDLP